MTLNSTAFVESARDIRVQQSHRFLGASQVTQAHIHARIIHCICQILLAKLPLSALTQIHRNMVPWQLKMSSKGWGNTNHIQQLKKSKQEGTGVTACVLPLFQTLKKYIHTHEHIHAHMSSCTRFLYLPLDQKTRGSRCLILGPRQSHGKTAMPLILPFTLISFQFPACMDNVIV